MINQTVTLTLRVPVDAAALTRHLRRPGRTTGPAALVAGLIAGALGDDIAVQQLRRDGMLGELVVSEPGPCDPARLTVPQLVDHRRQVARALEVAEARRVAALSDRTGGA